MLPPRKRRLQSESKQGHTRLVALIVVCITAALTYASVQSLALLVQSQRKGTDLPSGGYPAGGGGWSDTWRLASELGTGKLNTTLRCL